MIQISIDDKPINFDGPKPETVDQLIGIIGKHLFNNGRVIKTVLVDGEDGTTDGAILNKHDYNDVKFYTVDCNENMVNEISFLIENKDNILNFMNEFSHDLLNSEWLSNAHKSNKLSHMTLTIVVLLNRTLDLMRNGNKELLDQIESLLHDFKLTTNLYTSATSFKDTLCVADIVSDQLTPIVKQALNLIQGPVKSYFDWVTSPNPDFPA